MEKIKLCTVDIKSIDTERGIVPFVLTERVVDRDSEVIEPAGAVLDNYVKNPVFLWAHNLRQPPIGRVIPETIKKSKQRLKADVQFDLNDPFAALIFQKYANGFLNAGSIRFMPIDWSDEQVLEGQKRGTYKKWELLEFSAVPVPANPAALAMKGLEDEVPEDERAQAWLDELKSFFDNDNFDRTPEAWVEMKQKELERAHDEEAVQGEGEPQGHDDGTLDPQADGEKEFRQKMIEMLQKINDRLDRIAERLQETERQIDDNPVKRVVPYRRYPHAPEDQRWDAAAAKSRLRKWASSDGSGDKEKMNWGKYARAFAYVDPEKAEDFAGYKLPHHDVKDGKLVTVWRGVAAAMVALLGGRGGVDVPDGERKEIYNHLSKHYKEFDKPVPDFKDYEDVQSENEPEEVKAGEPELNVDEIAEQVFNQLIQDDEVKQLLEEKEDD